MSHCVYNVVYVISMWGCIAVIYELCCGCSVHVIDIELISATLLMTAPRASMLMDFEEALETKRRERIWFNSNSIGGVFPNPDATATDSYSKQGAIFFE